ncbi:MAG: M67 family metallopeptidase [Chloroflexota bacterium]
MTDAARPRGAGLRSTGSEPASTGVDPTVPDIAAWQAAADTGHARRGETLAGGGAARIATALLDEVVTWCLAGRPNEACGLLAGPVLAGAGGSPTRFLPLANAAASPYRYLIDPQEQLRAVLDIEDAGEEVWGIVHSHVASPAVPSDTDVGLAGWPDALYLICSLASEPPAIRAWSIRDGVVAEVDVSVAEAT